MLFFKRKIAIVSGISMEPILASGDIVIYKNVVDKSCLSTGDIVIFNHPTENINLIKKISSIKGNRVEVYGENTNFSNDSNDFGLINKASIKGKVTSRISNNLISSLKFMLNPKQ